MGILTMCLVIGCPMVASCAMAMPYLTVGLVASRARFSHLAIGVVASRARAARSIVAVKQQSRSGHSHLAIGVVASRARTARSIVVVQQQSRGRISHLARGGRYVLTYAAAADVVAVLAVVYL